MSDRCWRLVIHGGAGAMRPKHGDPDHEQRARDGLRAALDAGAAVLADSGAALDAVEASVRLLEDDPCFNAGRGSHLNAAGTCGAACSPIAMPRGCSPTRRRSARDGYSTSRRCYESCG